MTVGGRGSIAKGRPLGARCQWGTHVPRVPCALYTSLIVIRSLIINVLDKAYADIRTIMEEEELKRSSFKEKAM